MRQTHYAVIMSSLRIVPVCRMGKLLVVLHNRGSVSLCRYNKRFTLLPKDMNLGNAIKSIARAVVTA